MRRLPTCLILDFHDSYTRNILKLVTQTKGWDLEGWEQRIVVVNVDSLSWDSFVNEILPHIDCVILGPGPGTPHRDSDFSWPTRLIAEFGDRLPIFGLCLGLQGLATTFGGKVIKAAAPKHGQISRIRLDRTSTTYLDLFEGVRDEFDAVQYNSLMVDAASLPRDLEVTAWTDSAVAGREPEAMALQHHVKPLYGVQFHPESIASSFGETILSNFFAITLAFQQRQQPASEGSPDLPAHVLELSTAFRPRTGPSSPSDSSSSPSDSSRYKLLHVPLGSAAEWTTRKPSGVPQWSHLCIPQTTLSHQARSRTVLVRTAAEGCDTVNLDDAESFTSWLSNLQTALSSQTSFASADRPSVPVGFVGSIAYEMKDETMPLSKRHPLTVREQSAVELAFAALVLSYDHENGTWSANGLVRTAGRGNPTAEQAPLLLSALGVDEEEWTAWLERVSEILRRAPPGESDFSPAPLPTDFCPDQDRETYISSIESARRSIIAGDAYELCLTTQFRSRLPAGSPLLGDPYPFYLTLRATNPAPYCAYFHLPWSDFTLLSSSPERFIRIDRAGKADMKPIKGTVRRSPEDPVEDERRKRALLADEKERAENLMIVDLIRNDMLASCPVETVEVPGLMLIESYQTVHQMVTTVVGQLGEGVRPFEAMMRAFPPGSMTGAPKLRSLQLLDELEQRQDRGAYSGVFGYLAVDGASDWSVVIRTLVKRGRNLTLGGGGAITHKSVAENEWEEVLTKVDAVLGRTRP
ncbi:hypothetical protein B0A53_04481 [Rhodotorula sp. CCFEE 5036]|nr:hypothetical protein B0A53_04481 [Rhodotorula sp. CCFEE 5036]